MIGVNFTCFRYAGNLRIVGTGLDNRDAFLPVSCYFVVWKRAMEAPIEVIETIQNGQDSVVEWWKILDFLFQAHPANFDRNYNEYHAQMIIVRLRGGLGNQLFQYAAGKALAEHHRTELALDLYTYSKHPYRKFELSKFNIDAREATRSEVHQFTGNNPVVRYLNKLENYFRCPNVFAQPHYHFFEDFLSLPPDLYLSGYWQSEKYFSSVTSIIAKQLTPKEPLDAINSSLQNKIQSQNSVSLHVRRGDYASATTYSSFFGLLPKEYYEKAIAKMSHEVDNPIFYFFSDDPEWFRKTFAGLNGEFIDHNRSEDGYKDLLLMSSCRHNIIANSTFSWWGAWLNSHENKKVIAPHQWFRTNYLTKKEPVYASRFYNTKDLIPDSWIKL